MTIKPSLVWWLVCGLAPLIAHGQDTTVHADTVLPSEIATEVGTRYNAPATRHVVGQLDLPADSVLAGDVAIIDGPVTIAGHITGSLTAINTDVELKPGAHIDGDLLIVGGRANVPEPDSITVVGPTLAFDQRLHYHLDSAGVLVVEDDASKAWWRRWLALRHRRGFADFTVATARTYNRVEGLPIYLGPTVRRALPWGAASVEALGIVSPGPRAS